MNAKELSIRPSLEQYKKQAKELVKAHKTRIPEAVRRVQEHHPRPEILAKVAISDAQLVIAREHGFDSWPKFAKHVAALERGPEFLWKSAERALINADIIALEFLLLENDKMFREQQPPAFASGGLRPDYSAGDLQSILLRNHAFDTWADFTHFLEALKRSNSPVAQFETAVDAIVNGNMAALEQLLGENPDLIRARSTRKHRATLLHYVGSNGVEYFRQKCPKNIVAITRTLLQAGAEVGALADMYGKDTTLGLVATSVHPVISGVLIPLLEILLGAGAAMDNLNGTGSVVNACLHNGRSEAAEFLATRGARLDLEAASGVGRLDVVKTFFNDDGTLNAGATRAQMNGGFLWACEYGRTPVVKFLLDRGIEITLKGPPHGQTGLHWAAHAGQSDLVKLLIEEKAPLEVTDERFQGTPLAWALYAWRNPSLQATSRSHHSVVALLIAAGAKVEPNWLTDETLRKDPRMLALLARK